MIYSYLFPTPTENETSNLHSSEKSANYPQGRKVFFSLLESCIGNGRNALDASTFNKVLALLPDHFGSLGKSHCQQRGIYTLIDSLLMNAEVKLKASHHTPRELKAARSLLITREQFHIKLHHFDPQEECGFSIKVLSQASAIAKDSEKCHPSLIQAAIDLVHESKILWELLSSDLNTHFQRQGREEAIHNCLEAWQECKSDQRLLNAFRRFDKIWRTFAHLNLQMKIYELVNLDSQQLAAKMEEISGRYCLV